MKKKKKKKRLKFSVIFNFRGHKWQDIVCLYRIGVPIFFLRSISKLIEHNHTVGTSFFFKYLFHEIEAFSESCLFLLMNWIFQVTD